MANVNNDKQRTQQIQQRPQGQPEQQQLHRPTPQGARGGMMTRSSPFGTMRRFMEDMDRIFGDFGFGSFAPLTEQAGALWIPDVEILERNGKLEVRADLPGLKPDDVKIHVEEGVLTISGERRQDHETKEGGVHRCERSYGTFERAIALPEGVDPNAIEARFENGVLEVTMPMPKQELQQPRGRAIPIRGAGAATSGKGN